MAKFLFVCISNVFRSQLAAAFFNKYAKKHDAISSGINIGKSIPSEVRIIAKEEKLKLRKPRKISESLIKNADKIIILDSRIKLKNKKKTERWNIPDTNPNNNKEIRRIGKKIKKRIALLVRKNN